LTLGAAGDVRDADAATAKFTKRKIMINGTRYRRAGAEEARLGSMGVLRGGTLDTPQWQATSSGFDAATTKVEPLAYSETMAAAGETGAETLKGAAAASAKVAGAKDGTYKIYKLTIEPGQYASQINASVASTATAGTTWLQKLKDLDAKGKARIVTSVWVAVEAKQSQTVGGAASVTANTTAVAGIPISIGAAGSAAKTTTIEWSPETVIAYTISKVIWADKAKTTVKQLQEDRPGFLY
jgi:hypothetical protein